MLREPQEENKICSCFCDDLDSLEDGKLKSLALLTKFRKKNGSNSIKRQYTTHIHYACLISDIA